MTLTPGTRLGRFEIVGALGAGAMGEVYRARDPELEREVAIKVLPAELAQEPTRRWGPWPTWRRSRLPAAVSITGSTSSLSG